MKDNSEEVIRFYWKFLLYIGKDGTDAKWLTILSSTNILQ